MKTAYPINTDVQAFLVASGFTVTAGQLAFMDEAAAAGQQIIERRCGRVFLGSGSNSTRYFDPPSTRSGRLRIDDLASLNTVTYQPSGQVTATTWTENTDFWVQPDNRAVKLLPITSLVLKQRWSQPLSTAYRRSVIVSGQWGYATLAAGFPEAVWTAMLAAGCLEVYEMIAQALTGGLLNWREADVQEDYGVEPLRRLKDSWEARTETVVRLYRRWEI